MNTHISKKAFTMIELLIVIGLISVLMTISLIGINKQRILARDRMRVAGIDQIRLALEQYKLVCREYPNQLKPSANNGCRYGETLKDFLPVIPKVPAYASGSDATGQGSDYKYTGLSKTLNGKCYEYHIAVQLEYDYNNPANSEYLKNDHDFDSDSSRAQYKYPCRGGELLKNQYTLADPANDNGYKIYDMRSQTHQEHVS